MTNLTNVKAKEKVQIKDENNLFEIYGSKQMKVVQKWVNETPWLRERVSSIREDSTSFHDAIIVVSGTEYTIEVKEDEKFWYDKTGNIGLDAISWFHFKKDAKQWALWVNAEDYEQFILDINVGKWGKLFTCDANIQLFHVEGRLLKAYDNSKITTPEFQTYVTNKYNLRVNNKKDYKLKDSWLSAAYFLKPIDFKGSKADKKLQEMEVNSWEDLIATL